LKSTFDPDWREWIRVNLERGCDRSEMAKILVDHHFDPTLVLDTLGLNSIPDPPHPYDESDQEIPVPGAERISNEGGVQLYRIPRFLSPEECTRLIMAARTRLTRSRTSYEAGEYRDYRTSRTCFLGQQSDPYVVELDRRICRTLSIAPQCSEPLQAQWYDVGQEFKYHTDYFKKEHDGYQQAMNGQGQRTWTFMIYLNNTRRGGETEFPEINCQFQPEAGTAIVWRSTTPEGVPIHQSRHAGKPVESGFKVIVTKWFRERGSAGAVGNQSQRQENELLPAYSDLGFVKLQIPPDLYRTLRDFYLSEAGNAVPESSDARVSNSVDPGRPASDLIELDPGLKRLAHESLRETVESWIGHFLQSSYVYGIRRYLPGASLGMHHDRVKTHVASCTLNIAQDVDKPWPLVIEDHVYRRHLQYLAPGEMLLYEGARLLNGRPFSLEGREYAAAFVHYMVRGENTAVDDGTAS